MSLLQKGWGEKERAGIITEPTLTQIPVGSEQGIEPAYTGTKSQQCTATPVSSGEKGKRTAAYSHTAAHQQGRGEGKRMDSQPEAPSYTWDRIKAFWVKL